MKDPRDMSVGDMVAEYAITARQPRNPNTMYKLIKEEYEEWLEASDEESPEAELKELADLVYVIYGYARGMGFDLDMAMIRVHDNNMGRMYQDDGTILRRADGKIVKNHNYPKVKLDDLID